MDKILNPIYNKTCITFMISVLYFRNVIIVSLSKQNFTRVVHYIFLPFLSKLMKCMVRLIKYITNKNQTTYEILAFSARILIANGIFLHFKEYNNIYIFNLFSSTLLRYMYVLQCFVEDLIRMCLLRFNKVLFYICQKFIRNVLLINLDPANLLRTIPIK